HSQAQGVFPFPSLVQVGNLSPSIPNSERDLDENPAAFYSPYIENFHPIGWSADGKAAFLVWGEGTDNCHLGMRIYDAVKDTTIAVWNEDMSGSTILESEQIPAFWKRDADTIGKILHKYHIVSSKADYNNFPFSKNKDQYLVEYFILPCENSTRYFSGIDGNCVIYSNGENDSTHIHMSGFHAVDIQPTGIWFSPDGTYSLLVGYYETNYSEARDNPHSFSYFVKKLK
ncbi:MAG TPA: hypothetical protein VL651_15240, partial [Bacteroidia bacterium]|nr:hypothetical protein [Bacteroidia bacterium]